MAAGEPRACTGGRCGPPPRTCDADAAAAGGRRAEVFRGRTEAETAAALGCSVGTVKTHHSRAIARLRASSLLALPTEEPR
ncbi:MAG: sigma factor-like helix-turn-helix DNA-binding protein [Nocardioidaceae bacterium]